MQLVFLLTKTTENKISFFLSDGRRYKYSKGTFKIKDSLSQNLLLHEDDVPQGMHQVCHGHPMYGTVFNKYSTVTHSILKEEVVILRGVSLAGIEVFCVLLLDKGTFRRYLNRINEYPNLIVEQSKYVASGPTSTRGVKQLFLDLKSSISFTTTIPIIQNPCMRINFYNEEGRIEDCCYCLSKTKLSL